MIREEIDWNSVSDSTKEKWHKWIASVYQFQTLIDLKELKLHHSEYVAKYNLFTYEGMGGEILYVTADHLNEMMELLMQMPLKKQKGEY